MTMSSDSPAMRHGEAAHNQDLLPALPALTWPAAMPAKAETRRMRRAGGRCAHEAALLRLHVRKEPLGRERLTQ